MKIGAFIQTCATTRDTIRHYEQMGLLHPAKRGTFKDYGEKELSDFQAIKELQQIGLSLKTIQNIFEIKRQKGCGTPELIQSVLLQFEKQKRHLHKEDMLIRRKIILINRLDAALRNIL